MSIRINAPSRLIKVRPKLEEWIMLQLKKLNLLAIALLLALTACGGGGGDDDGVPPPVTSVPPPVIKVFKTFQSADTVIGQPNFSSVDSNQGGLPGASTLNIPIGAPGAGSLYVVDSFNNRILGFNTVPTINNASADFVIGQGDFISNVLGVDDDRLSQPYDLSTEGGQLFVVDRRNHRVLIWNTLPTITDVPADVVLGAANFTDNTPGTSKFELNDPWAIAVANGQLFVTDRGNNRVLIWNSIPTLSYTPADVVIGQLDFDSGGSGLSATQLNTPAGIWSDGQRLAVADRSNSRVLIWNTIPSISGASGAAADLVVGQPDFDTKIATVTSQGLNEPFSVYSNGQELYISDTNNNRVLIFNNFPTTNQPSADRVLGQSDFLKKAANDDNQDGSSITPSSRTFSHPTDIGIIDSQLYVTDSNNNRVLIFQPN